MATELKFEKEGVNEVCVLESPGVMVLQVDREKQGFFTVYANLEGMKPTPIANVLYQQNIIHILAFPKGVTITIVSGTHVTGAKYETIEE